MYYPELGGAIDDQIPSQFARARTTLASFACTLIKQLSNDGKDTVLSHGSGCFWRHNGDVFILTARHVLTGRSPFDDTILSQENQYIPKRITVFPTVTANPNAWLRQNLTVEINHDPPNFLQDPEFDQLRTDIAALFLCHDEPAQICCLNDDNSIFGELFTLVGMDCSVVGYPTPHFSGLMVHIWKRGSIALETNLQLDRKPMFLLDANTSPGFSGSPVFRQHFGPLPVLQDDSSIELKVDNVRTISFVGIYAGRLRHRHVGGEVPFVFYANRIPRLFQQR